MRRAPCSPEPRSEPRQNTTPHRRRRPSRGRRVVWFVPDGLDPTRFLARFELGPMRCPASRPRRHGGCGSLGEPNPGTTARIQPDPALSTDEARADAYGSSGRRERTKPVNGASGSLHAARVLALPGERRHRPIGVAYADNPYGAVGQRQERCRRSAGQHHARLRPVRELHVPGREPAKPISLVRLVLGQIQRTHAVFHDLGPVDAVAVRWHVQDHPPSARKDAVENRWRYRREEDRQDATPAPVPLFVPDAAPPKASQAPKTRRRTTRPPNKATAFASGKTMPTGMETHASASCKLACLPTMPYSRTKRPARRVG